jgi:hypothetical protein
MTRPGNPAIEDRYGSTAIPGGATRSFGIIFYGTLHDQRFSLFM